MTFLSSHIVCRQHVATTPPIVYIMIYNMQHDSVYNLNLSKIQNKSNNIKSNKIIIA